jgi:hypothetical protein
LLPSVAQKACTGTSTYWTPDKTGTITIGPFSTTEQVAYLGGTQVTTSEGHQVSRLKKAGLEDIGGPFTTTRSYVDLGKTDIKIRDEWDQPFGSMTQYLKYEGVLFPRIGLTNPDANGRRFPAFPSAVASSDDDLAEHGTTAIARCKPTNPPVDAAVAIGELYREGLPHLIGSQSWQARTERLKAAGSDYLNVAFGWKPLLSDVSSFAKTIRDFDTVLAQYERDSGRVVRRSYEFPIERTTGFRIENNNPIVRAIAHPGNLVRLDPGGPGPTLVDEESTTRRWFSGAFTYYLPSGHDSRKQLDRLRLMADRVGLSPTPDTLWNLAPWSWAVDWFSNAGDVISNVSDFGTGGLVMHYGYIMEHTVSRWTYFQPQSGFLVGGKKKAAGPISMVTETKVRRQANPYGFGVTWEGLSAFQASILAALGITRRR